MSARIASTSGVKRLHGRRGSSLQSVVALMLAAVAAQAWSAETWREWEAAKIRLHAERMRVLARGNCPAVTREAAIESERQQLREALGRLTADSAAPAARGVRLEAYVSPNDDSPQPFWRYLPVSQLPTNPPLLIFLHGYAEDWDLASAPGIPDFITNVAEEAGACIAAPFGRGNTDYQHLGEQDVLRVLDEMVARFGADRERVVLAGVSMGGLGVWCIGARWADRFNMLLPICGRGDFYVWHRLTERDLPPWQRELVDTQFATRYLDRLRRTSIMATHGRFDDIVTFEQGAYPPAALRRLGATRTTLIEFTRAGHDVFGISWEHELVRQRLLEGLTTAFTKPRPRASAVPGASGSRVQDAFLTPFLFVGGDDGGAGDGAALLEARSDEWQRYGHARPRQTLERELDLKQAASCNLFVFGEPEWSLLTRAILERGGVAWDAESFTIAGRRLPRAGHGLWFTGRNPFNTNLAGVVQCGLPWGAGQSDNHRYDRIPDVIVYGPDTDRFGYNLAAAAGFVDSDGSVRWCDPPITDAIRRPQVCGEP
ncbi:MAG: prolyl oligopeptidase family serine peptidase [Kiritimatiellae bacterium]|nr:prolyl oligopeptidase family serine peptidase [Kiritimatiellia bacterium]